MNANSIVQKLWRLCAVLRKDGITYQQYVTELTYLLFLKMMAERGREEGQHPRGISLGGFGQGGTAAKTAALSRSPHQAGRPGGRTSAHGAGDF
ncbi:type I restriction-modification system subunit M N-terminal domain-containing protein [uncultured Cohaesibacter sp.]|uniref:type I restriction-modification system subunit M N-terminal domain-containing protein n=1 Tax=uncultured Cohaesibacter sp. TaxID=1002546 RepID=UPI0029309795|nr:type I restriction-modification system subunit M N-terminal domain-containing protein [uncultured Cohaesibacter sp.]